MPNNIQNKLQIIGNDEEVQKVLTYIKGKYDDGKEIQIDFNRIKPIPKGMHGQIHSGIEMWVKICTGQINFACLFTQMEKSHSKMFKDGNYGNLAERIGASIAMEYLTGKRSGNVKDLSDDDFNSFIQCLKNYREHGSIYWHDWSIKNWGTKWNAYNQNDQRNTEDTIYFQTAWSSPIGLIEELSKIFPLVKICLTYADEDRGSNTGMITFENGEAIEVNQPESQSIQGYDIYFELHPGRKEDYKLVDGKYEHVEES